jgi:Sulfotransferase domain
MTDPNFLIIGDLKAGSTSLFSYVSQHPEAFMPAMKELRYFSYDETNPYHRESKAYRVKTIDEYMSFFLDTGNAKAIGEASPNYLRSPCAAQKIHSRLPGTKLILSLRNPADRLFSVFQMRFRGSGGKVPRFEELLFSEDAAWIKGNFYSTEIERFLSLFPREQLCIILFDDLSRRPAEVARTVYRFLGLDTSFVPVLEAQNVGGVPKSPALYSVLNFGKNQLKRLGEPPSSLRRTWASIRKNSLRKETMSPTLRRKILEVCDCDIMRTQSLIQQDLSSWRVL